VTAHPTKSAIIGYVFCIVADIHNGTS